MGERLNNYVRKAYPVHAKKFDPNAPESEWPEGVFYDHTQILSGPVYQVKTPSGFYDVKPGDWIVPGDPPYSPERFEELFEPI